MQKSEGLREQGQLLADAINNKLTEEVHLFWGAALHLDSLQSDIQGAKGSLAVCNGFSSRGPHVPNLDPGTGNQLGF